MSDVKLCAEMLHRIFPALDVSNIKTVETQKDVNPELKRFLNFMDKNELSEDPFVKILDEKVREAKDNIKWRSEFMTLLTIEDEKFAEGRIEGEQHFRLLFS